MAIQWSAQLLQSVSINELGAEIAVPMIYFAEKDTITGETWRYVIVLVDGDTKQTVLARLKTKVVAARATRTKFANVTLNFDSAALETYLTT